MTTERHSLLREFRPNSIRIKLHSAIGEGLSANVYRGVREDSRGFTSQPVAVKITKTAGEAKVLRREFETLLQVQSPHLVRVYAWDDHGDESMLSMEFIDGADLCALMNSNLLDEDLVEEVLTQVQEGLKALSKKGLEHGDLSPANILIDRYGVVKLIDFANPERGSGFAHGTPPYMAPEVWAGSSGSIASDLFALGLLQNDLRTRLQNPAFVVPATSVAARARCHQLADENSRHPWLALAPSARHFTDRHSSPERQARLGRAVEIIRSTQTTEEKSVEYGAKKGGNSSIRHLFPSRFPQGWIRRVRERHRAAWLVLVALLSVFLGLAGIITNQSSQHLFGNAHSPETRQVMPARTALEVSLTAPATSPLHDHHRNSVVEGNVENPQLIRAGSLQIRTHRWMHLELDTKDLGYAPVRILRVSPGKHRLKWTTSAASGVKWIEIRAAQCTFLKEDDFKSSSQPGRP